MSKIYVAGPWDFRNKAKEVADKFEAAGHEITHKWWLHDAGVGGLADTEYHRQCAINDVNGVLNADVFYLLNLQERGKETSGKAVELGLALAGQSFFSLDKWHNIKIFIEGPYTTNVFQLLNGVQWVTNVEEVIERLMEAN